MIIDKEIGQQYDIITTAINPVTIGIFIEIMKK